MIRKSNSIFVLKVKKTILVLTSLLCLFIILSPGNFAAADSPSPSPSSSSSESPSPSPSASAGSTPKPECGTYIDIQTGHSYRINPFAKCDAADLSENDINKGLEDFGVWLADGFKNWLMDPITRFAKYTTESLGNMLGDVNKFWIEKDFTKGAFTNNFHPTITSYNGSGISKMFKILDYVEYVSLCIAILSLIIILSKILLSKDKSIYEIFDKTIKVLLCVVGITTSAVIIKYLFDKSFVSGKAGGLIEFLRTAMFQYTIFFLILGSFIAFCKALYDSNQNHIKQAGKVIIQTILVCAGSVMVSQLLIAATDSYSKWILAQATGDHSLGSAGKFSDSVHQIQNFDSKAVSIIMLIIFGLISLILVLLQMLLLMFRSICLPFLIGFLPITSASSLFKTGAQAFNKNIGWILAFILYKPVAATIYAGGEIFVKQTLSNNETANDLPYLFISICIVFFLGTFALPMLMRILIPSINDLGNQDHSLGATAGAMAAGIATGAIATGTGMATGAMAQGVTGALSGGFNQAKHHMGQTLSHGIAGSLHQLSGGSYGSATGVNKQAPSFPINNEDEKDKNTSNEDIAKPQNQSEVLQMANNDQNINTKDQNIPKSAANPSPSITSPPSPSSNAAADSLSSIQAPSQSSSSNFAAADSQRSNQKLDTKFFNENMDNDLTKTNNASIFNQINSSDEQITPSGINP